MLHSANSTQTIRVIVAAQGTHAKRLEVWLHESGTHHCMTHIIAHTREVLT